jgi:gamma-glutamyltranspeptidase/glutathione hydrolase
MQLAVATTNQIAADVAGDIADAGGNAVDAAVAASLITLITEPGVCAPGGGGYLTVGLPGREVLTIDANVEMPGRSADSGRFGVRDRVAHMDYGGGITTTVGHASVATPGALAGLGLAHDRWGVLPWRSVVEPAVAVSRTGFPLSAASRLYLGYSHEVVFGWHPDSHAALHHDDGSLAEVGDIIRVAGLADTLEAISIEGVETMYRGEVARAIASEFEANGGLLTLDDLEAYRPIVRPATTSEIGGYLVATNPPPAIGGVALLSMLQGVTPGVRLREDEVVARQLATLRARAAIEAGGDYGKGTLQLEAALRAHGAAGMQSPSTVHTSAVDGDGIGCAITMSAGYGSGLIPAGTGFWMNNALGEEELNPSGFHTLRPGTRLGSNMAPTIVEGPEMMLAVGSPGADRITSALQQVIARVLGGAGLSEAIAAPRLHVELSSPRQAPGTDAVETVTVATEPGVDPEAVGYPVRPFPSLDMFFGGVTAAMLVGKGGRSDGEARSEVAAGADPRRTGGTIIR